MITSKHANNEKLEKVACTQSLKAPSLDSPSEEYPDLLPVGGPPPVLLASLLGIACFSHMTVRACLKVSWGCRKAVDFGERSVIEETKLKGNTPGHPLSVLTSLLTFLRVYYNLQRRR